MSDATFFQKIVGQLNALLLPRALDLLDYRFFYFDPSVDPGRKEYNEHCVIAFWHEYIVSVLPRWGHTPVTALCSKHRDGEWVNQTAASLGMHVVRGSSSRGGAAAIRQIRKNREFSSVAMTPDGPLGPRRVMAPGPIFMASALQMPLVLMGVGISNPIRLKTWDRFAIPRPSSRIRIIMGPKIHIPRKLSREEMEARRVSAERLLNDLTRKAEQWALTGCRLQGATSPVRSRRSNKLRFDQSDEPLKLVGVAESLEKAA